MNSRFLWGYIGRRLAMMLVLLLIVAFLVFTLLHFAAGDPVQMLLGTRLSTPQLVHELRLKYHLDDPFFQQFLIWLKGTVRLDFGTSVRSGQSVTAIIASRAGVTLFLTIYAFAITVLIGVPLGVIAAVRKRGAIDRSVVGLSVLGVSMPPFVSGIFFLLVFAVTLGWFPTYGVGGGVGGRFWHLTLPALTLALTLMALVVKLTRAAMITVLEQDYVTFARARGVAETRVIVRHALRNALIPVVTASGLVFTALLTSTVLVEVAFALPGVGGLLIDSVENKDMPVVMGITMVLAVLIVVANIVIDVLFVVVDPRVRFGSVGQ